MAVAEEGQMTFALHSEAGTWKIHSWTWSGVKPQSCELNGTSDAQGVPALEYRL